MNLSEMKATIEEAKKRHQNCDLEKQEKEKKNLFAKIAENQQKKLIRQTKALAFDNKKKFFLWMSSSGIAASIIVVLLVLLGFSYVDRGKYIVPEDKNNDGNGVIPEDSQEFKEMDRFLENLMTGQGGRSSTVRTFPKGTIDRENKKEIEKVLNSLDGNRYKISYVQSDRKANCYYVMCDFNDKGNYYLTVEKLNSYFRLVSIVFF